MVATKLKTVSPIIAMERQASYAGSSVTLASAFTLPSNVGDIWCYPSANCHWNPVGTATTASPSHKVVATEPFMIPVAKHSTAEIIGDSGAITLIVAYMRGSRKSINHAVSRPY